MPKHESRRTKEAQSPNDEKAASQSLANLLIRHSFELRHSDFVCHAEACAKAGHCGLPLPVS
jgi:hypothetical protein